MPKQWPGTQSDNYTYDRTAKPEYPPCDTPKQFQFAESVADESFGGRENYIPAEFDRWNNPIPEKRPFDHNEPDMGDAGSFGDRQFSSNRADLQSSGYGKNEGLNVIEYGQSAAFQPAEKVVVDNSRADRGREN